MPFFDAQSKYAACIALCSGMRACSKTVPTFTVNCFRQSRHFHKPADNAAVRAYRPGGPQNALQEGKRRIFIAE
jgi:hypothetical protein